MNRTKVRAVVRRILFRNVPSFVAMVGLFLLAAYTALYILDHQNLRLPVLDEKAWTLKAEFTTAQAVVPGQGQTIRVSGIRIGDVTGVELHDGRALVTFAVDQRYRRLVHRDATALLRPKTGLKDMFVELTPGTQGPPVRDGFVIPVASTLPDVNTDEVLAALDGDTRDYLRLLLQGVGEGLHKRGDDFGEVMRRLEPTHRDLRRVVSAVALRRRNLRRLVSHLARLNGELSGHDDQLTRLVSQSEVVFRAFASEEHNISGTVARLPGALHETTHALGKVQRLADELRPAASELRPAVRALTRANGQVAPAARAVTPIVRSQVRPFAREAQPLVRELRGPSAKMAKASPDFTRLGVVLNHTLNLFGYNPNGREAPGTSRREEGYLFWLAWLGHQSVNIFSSADANGTMRPIAFAGTCNTLASYASQNPQMEFLLNLTPILGSPACKGQG